jgi:hypothetical protein
VTNDIEPPSTFDFLFPPPKPPALVDRARPWLEALHYGLPLLASLSGWVMHWIWR